MVKDGSSSSSSSSSSSDSGSGGSGSSSSSSSSSSGGDSPLQKPTPVARPAKSTERGAREASRRARSPSRSPRALKRKRESPVRRSRQEREDSPPRRRRASPPIRSGERERRDRGEADDGRRRRSPEGDRYNRRRDVEPRRGGREDRQNEGRDLPLPPPPPRSGDRDRHGRGGRERRSGFGEVPAEEDAPSAGAPSVHGSAPPVEGKLHRSRANRWEPQEDGQPLPGPPGPPGGPPQREDRDWNHQSKDEAFPQEDKPPPEANFALSGKLAEESNTVNGVVLLHAEPPEARRPSVRWRLYTFKNGDMFGEPLPIHKQTCYFFGRERRVADIPTDHPSCSKQHAILQYRLTDKDEGGLTKSEVRPYIMDLGSTNGTFLNNERLDSQRYYELLAKDLIRFGNSSREYVLLHERALEES